MHPATTIAFAAIDFEKNANAAAAKVLGHALPASEGALGKGLDILGWLNSGGGKKEELLRKVMSYNFVDPANRLKNVAGGATIGAGIGGLDADKGHKMKGALGGAVGGGLFGRFAPGMAQKGMGRILTNLVEPRSYETAEKIKKLKGYKIMDMIKAVVKDKPIYEAAKFPNEVTTRGPYSAREVPYRMGFGLKPRAFRKFFTADPTEKRVLHYNPKSREAQSELKSMTRDITGNSMIDPSTGAVPKGNADGSQLVRSRGVPGNFHVKPDGTFEDNWDFGLHPHEKIDSLGSFGRAFVNMFTSPVKLKGKLPMPVAAPAISPDAAKSLIIHPGNMGPGVNKLLMGDKKLRGGEPAAVNEALNRLMNAAPTASEVPPTAGNLSGINFSRILGPGGNKIPLPAESAVNGDLNIPFRKVKIPGAVPEPEYSDFLGPNGERLLKSAAARYLAFALMDMEKNAMMAAVKSKLFNAAKTLPMVKNMVRETVEKAVASNPAARTALAAKDTKALKALLGQDPSVMKSMEKVLSPAQVQKALPKIAPDIPAGKVTPPVAASAAAPAAEKFTPQYVLDEAAAAKMSPFEKRIRKLLDTNLVVPENRMRNTVAGSAIGAGVGAHESDDGHKLRGALLGAGGGGLLGHHGPQVIQRTAGRVISNSMVPIGYTKAHVDRWKNAVNDLGIGAWFKAIKSDTLDSPFMKHITEQAQRPAPNTMKEWSHGREFPWRKMWGLKPRNSSAADHVVHPNGRIGFADTEMGRTYMHDLTRSPNADTPPYHSILGTFERKNVPEGVHYRDRWDFDLDKGEHPLGSGVNFARWLASRFNNPPVYEGVVPHALSKGKEVVPLPLP